MRSPGGARSLCWVATAGLLFSRAALAQPVANLTLDTQELAASVTYDLIS